MLTWRSLLTLRTLRTSSDILTIHALFTKPKYAVQCAVCNMQYVGFLRSSSVIPTDTHAYASAQCCALNTVRISWNKRSSDLERSGVSTVQPHLVLHCALPSQVGGIHTYIHTYISIVVGPVNRNRNRNPHAERWRLVIMTMTTHIVVGYETTMESSRKPQASLFKPSRRCDINISRCDRAFLNQ